MSDVPRTGDLRDYFATAMINGFLSAGNMPLREGGRPDTPALVDAAYEIAELMLSRRLRTSIPLPVLGEDR